MTTGQNALSVGNVKRGIIVGLVLCAALAIPGEAASPPTLKLHEARVAAQEATDYYLAGILDARHAVVSPCRRLDRIRAACPVTLRLPDADCTLQMNVRSKSDDYVFRVRRLRCR